MPPARSSCSSSGVKHAVHPRQCLPLRSVSWGRICFLAWDRILPPSPRPADLQSWPQMHAAGTQGFPERLCSQWTVQCPELTPSMVPLGNCRFLRAVGGFALSSPPACLFRCAASKAAAAPSFVAGCVELCRKDGWHDCDCSGPPLNRAIDVQRCSFIVTRGHEGARGRVGGAGRSHLSCAMFLLCDA